jgi:hypothetical protein
LSEKKVIRIKQEGIINVLATKQNVSSTKAANPSRKRKKLIKK